MNTHSLTQPMPEKQPLAVVVVHPRAFRQPKQPKSDRRGLRELADVVSLHRFGVRSLLLPTEQRELLCGFLEELLDELDALSAEEAS